MSHPILATGAAGGAQGSAGRLIANLLLGQGIPVRLLANPNLPSQSAYPPISAAPTVKEMTEALGRAIGRPVRYVAITDEQWTNAVKERLNPHALDHLTHLWQSFRKGGERYQATDTVRAVSGRNPQTLEEFFRENTGFFAASSR